MSSRGEKGFRQIKIVDSNYDYSDQYETQSISKTKLILIISIAIILILLLIVILLLIDGKKKKSFYIRRTSKFNKTKKYINYNQSNYNNREYYNEDKKEEIANETYNIDELIKNVEKRVMKQESNIKDNIKISIIVMNNNKEIKNDWDKLYESIISQEFPDKEIIIVGNNVEINSTSNNIEKIKKESTIVEYEIKTGKIMQRYDIVKMAKGEYILFLEGDDSFSSNEILKQIYEKAKNDKIDILEYKTYHQMPPKDRILYQPEIFSSMYFGEDDYNRLIQFHLCGKLIKRDFFLDTFKEVNDAPFYFKKNIQNFDQSMILLVLLRKAKTFEVLDIQGTTNSCNKCEKNKNVAEIKDALDLLIYTRFLIENTGDNVPEKRMAVNIFINDFLNKRINFEDKDDLNMLKETVDLYLKCDKIGEQDFKTIENYKYDILDKLKNVR
jgi:glycosyltransferase involved in cell wall biosynthesis